MKHELDPALENLIKAGELLITTSPCSDPDCCQTAIDHADAMKYFKKTLIAYKEARDFGAGI